MITVKFLRELSQKLEVKHSVSLKSLRRFLHLSSFSGSNSFRMVSPHWDS